MIAKYFKPIKSKMNFGLLIAILFSLMTLSFPGASQAEETAPVENVLTQQQWQRVDHSVEKGLAWLASQQRRDGSFPTEAHGQPGVTGLCVLAFLAHGHLPGEGKYGQQLERAISYVIQSQQPNGLLAYRAPRGEPISRDVDHHIGTSSSYNHAIGSLVLSEVYGMVSAERAAELEPVIRKSLDTSLLMQRWPKMREIDKGGWRYLNFFPPRPQTSIDSDLTVTSWHLMFLRSSQNAGFQVPKASIDEAIEFIRRCYQPEDGNFDYYAGKNGNMPSRGNSGSAILALAHAGYHDSPEAHEAGKWILKYPFDRYNEPVRFNQSRHQKDRYHYSVFKCSYAMYQLGGNYWRRFFPVASTTLIDNQQPVGSWPAENFHSDGQYGKTYSTALVLLTLGTPNQLLPVLQR